MQRGIERRDIFTSAADKERFFNYLEELFIRYRVTTHAYCLMGNHYHLLIETPEGNLAKAMHTLNTSYTTYFNKRKKRNGHLFQGRYKSILVQADEYLHHLSRYIHLNPVRAYLVKDPADYTWSSYRYYVSKDNAPKWLRTDFILSCFGRDTKKARKEYKQFVLTEVDKHKSELRDKGQSGLILGDDDFVEWIKNTFILKMREDEEIPVLKQLRERITLKDVEKEVQREVSEKNLARKLGIYLSRKYTGMKLQDIATVYGKIGDTGVSQAYYRVEKARKDDRRLHKTIRKIEKRLNV